MNHYGTLRDFRFSDEEIDDIRGSNIYGLNDEKLGQINDVIFDHNTGVIRYVVVDSGGWLSSKNFIVPADRLQPSAKHKDDFQVDLSKKQIENFPPYEESALSDSKRWNEYDDRYQKKMMTDGDVMHRKDAPDRIITPPADEIIASMEATRTHLGPRWNNFEERVRRDRTQIASTCNVCRFTPESASTVERDRARKVS